MSTMSSEPPSLSLVVPAFNESQRIALPLREMASYLAEQPYSSEIIVVDDGSSDGTFELVCGLGAELPVPLRALRYCPNRGKGHALKVGFAASRADRILFTDADLSTPIEATASLLEPLEAGADIAIGSRWLKGAEVKVHQPWYREYMGRVFTLLVRSLIVDVSDATCGFKAFRGDVGRDLFSRARVRDWSFDAELLFLAHQRHYAIVEVPVEWEDREGTKVNLLRDAVNSFIGLIQIRLNSAAGRYREGSDALPAREIWPREAEGIRPAAGHSCE